ncbi:MAG: dihydroxyacetone kinase phosphoryl donor subunit DhaM [Candidatus Dormibacteraeota bacterium]|nr:dihydroxyacetone kinase phosphoryl donor subunit DhaM [Candidatus Dormibacteraeota bacterium]
MVGIVLVSHSQKLAEGLQELVGQLAQGRVQIAAAGGAPQGGLGTSADKIGAAIRSVAGPDGVLVLVDLGSAILSTELAIETLDPAPPGPVQISAAPFVEGAVVAVIHAGLGNTLAEVAAAATEARHLPKNLQ